MASISRRFFLGTSLLALLGIAAACGGPLLDQDQDQQAISGASSLVSHSGGAITVNDRIYYLDSSLQVANGTFTGTIHEDLTPDPIRPPDPWQFLDMLIKAHPRGTFFDYVGKSVGDTSIVNIDVGSVGWLRETTTVVGQNPLRFEHVFEGDLTLPESDIPVLPWNKSDMHFLYSPNGTLTGSATIKAVVIRGQEEVQVNYPVQYSGTFTARPVVRLPVAVAADVSFQHYDVSTGAFSGVESSKAVKP